MDRGDDAVGRFVTWIETSPAFRDAIASGDEGQIAQAIDDAGISLPESDRTALIDACIRVTALDAWGAMDDIRRALVEERLGSLG
jgi:hypothetical protein